MAFQVLKLTRHPLLSTLSNMDDVVHSLAKEAEAIGFVVMRTEIDFDTSSKKCAIEIHAEKRGAM